MTLAEYLRSQRGRTKQLALTLGVSGSLVTQWAAGKTISVERCSPIERLSDGAVRRWDMRPADWHVIWPELVGAEGAPAVLVAEEMRDAA